MGLAEKYPVRYTVKDRESWQGDWELVEGIPYAMASPRPINQYILSRLVWYLLNRLTDPTYPCHYCRVYVELNWYVSEDTVIRPDLLVFCGDVPEKLEKPPKLFLEIVSPSSRLMDEGLKLELCEKEGVKYFVLVYPEEKKVRVFEIAEGKYRQKENKGFSFEGCDVEMDLEKVFNE